MPPGSPVPLRSAQEVIDAAIRESRAWEWVCLGLTVTTALVGIALLVFGAVKSDWGIAGPGVAAAAVLPPALWAATRIRLTNIRIRLLEIPLGKAKTTAEAASVIASVFRPGRGQTSAHS